MPENRALVFSNVPSGLPVAGKDLTVESVPYPEEAPENGIVVKNLYASFDPYMRGRMRGMSHSPSSPPAFIWLASGPSLMTRRLTTDD